MGLSISALSNLSGVSISSLKRYEATSGVPKASKGHLQLLRNVFQAHGIEFVGTPDDRPGIRVDTLRR
ncbi:hypothetical protein LOKVESSMR4R_01571 [Yoonia vestfoldensis]|uniref:Transcriptional regulator n=1 Tax=Yoonia vestfoldensis TaxID=245188 RepID=A0A1Y0EB76_9RHOB|nr:hypothetical protein LOKVESSMR4R_01571 [Yoonia vestfoldensis]